MAFVLRCSLFWITTTFAGSLFVLNKLTWSVYFWGLFSRNIWFNSIQFNSSLSLFERMKIQFNSTQVSLSLRKNEDSIQFNTSLSLSSKESSMKKKQNTKWYNIIFLFFCLCCVYPDITNWSNFPFNARDIIIVAYFELWCRDRDSPDRRFHRQLIREHGKGFEVSSCPQGEDDDVAHCQRYMSAQSGNLPAAVQSVDLPGTDGRGP